MPSWTITRAAIFSLALGGAACQAADSDPAELHEPAATEAAPAPAPVPAAAVDVELGAMVDISVHESWARVSEPRGTRWSSPKSDVQLFFGAIRPSDQPRAVIEGLAAKWGASDIRWGEEQKVTIGAERLPALAADGACTTRAGEATIAYATTDTGRGTLLVAYLFDKDASPETREIAMKAVASFTKK